MTHIRVKGFKIFDDRHGKTRCYHRLTGHKIDLDRAPLGSAAFFAECDKIVALAVTSRVIIDPLPEQLRPLALPVLDRVDG